MKRILLPALLAAALPTLAQEWKPLFNGKDLATWIGDTNGYEIVDGTLICRPNAQHMRTAAQYADYELEFEFTVPPGGNNGIGIRATPGKDPAYNGMEIQILDDDDPQYAKLHDYQYHGSIYGVKAAKRGHLKPDNEWNKERILVLGDHIKVELNGTVITEAWLDKDKPADGKQHPGLTNRTGHIVLCSHGHRVQFRNMRIREFTLPTGQPAAAAAEGYTPLYNGKDLAGWRGFFAPPHKMAEMTPDQIKAAVEKVAPQVAQHWKAAGAEIVTTGHGQNLCTEKDYADFDLTVDWMIQKNGDSGIYLRGTPQVQIWDPMNERETKNGADKGSGCLWNNQKAGNRPLVKADKPAGEWNTFAIRMVGEKVTVHLNGQLVVDAVPLENYWQRQLPIFPTGPIELQAHGNEVRFKNILVRELPR